MPEHVAAPMGEQLVVNLSGVRVHGSSRTIEANPSITIGEWVKSVFDSKNLTFTDETKSFEKVGGVLRSCLCFLETRAKGAVIEIRALDGTQKCRPASGRLSPTRSWR